MIFKHHDRMVDEYCMLSPYLRMLIADVEIWCLERKIQPVWTCFIRSEEENRQVGGQPLSVHLFGRGADMRLLHDDAMNVELLEYVNNKYRYDPSRPEKNTALIHGPVNHFHFQSLR